MIDGVYVIDKPSGISSFAVVRKFQKIFASKAFGHAGTLDPLASGVIVIMAGSATKLAPYLIENDKIYEAGIMLGASSDTLDVTGKIQAVPMPALSEKQIEEAVQGLAGNLELVPPAYSAIHVAGARAYQLARRGASFALEKKVMPVKEAILKSLMKDEQGNWHLQAFFHVGKGTYIRSLAAELGQRLGGAGVMESLVRIASGPFQLKDALPFSAVTAQSVPAFTNALALKARGFRLVNLGGKMLFKVDNGISLSLEEIPRVNDESLIALTQGEKLRGVYQFDAKRKVWKADRVWK